MRASSLAVCCYLVLTYHNVLVCETEFNSVFISLFNFVYFQMSSPADTSVFVELQALKADSSSSSSPNRTAPSTETPQDVAPRVQTATFERLLRRRQPCCRTTTSNRRWSTTATTTSTTANNSRPRVRTSTTTAAAPRLVPAVVTS